MATYVEGEAVETDSEDEQYLFNLSYMKVCFHFLKFWVKTWKSFVEKKKIEKLILKTNKKLLIFKIDLKLNLIK